MSVYVCQEPLTMRRGKPVKRIDLEAAGATQFGDLRYVLSWKDTQVIEPRADRLVWKIRQALRDFSEHDFIIPIGDPTVIQLVGIIAGELAGGRYRVLQWDNQLGRYDVIEVDIHCQPPRSVLP